MALQRGFQKRSRKRSSAGRAFVQRNNDGQKWTNLGKAGDVNFMKRLLGKAGVDFKSCNGETELRLLAQLGDSDAIQLLIDNGYDAKDALGLSSLAGMALAGDMDAARLLANKGFSMSKKVTAEDIDGPSVMNFSVAAPVESPLRKALTTASQRIQQMSHALQQEKQTRPVVLSTR